MSRVLEPLTQAAVSFGSALAARAPYILAGAIVFAAFLLISNPVGRVVCRVGRFSHNDNLSEILRRMTRAALAILGLLVSAVIIFPNFQPGDLIAGLGITSVAIGFAFKDILQNFFAGILILWREPFRIGDQIRSGDYEGTVEEITTRSTRLRTYDGERAVLPNGIIYTNPILVRTAYSERRVRFQVGIGYKDPVEKARRVIGDVLNRAAGVLSDPEPWIFVQELAPDSVNLGVYFWVEPRQANVLQVSDRVATGIKLALDEHGIDMPYPHRVVLLRREDGSGNAA